MIESVLIANRGEIARRIIRTARRLGVRTVAVFSEADADLPFVREADGAVPIGPASARRSYLDQERILQAAETTGAAAIHPGYGFLSENADFAQAVLDAGLVWIGPPPSAIRAMGSKDAAKALMQASGVPVTPGYFGDDQTADNLRRQADAIGYPVLIKAVAGGGGKGMRLVERSDRFDAALASCRREAAASFGSDRMLIESCVGNPRHIEVQVFGDSHGNIVHLFERDCSIQRRHQKVIEEAPAPSMDAASRDAVTAAAVRAARAIGYVGAGTVEFIADASGALSPDRIWFMEMNTRLQVEHPVTEAITGVDLVEWQFRVAAGEPLPCRQDDLAISGWAMEARLYAERPEDGFLPSTGRLTHLRMPDGVRVDIGVGQGDEVTPHYDPMIAKIIVHAPDRESAAARLAEACAAVEVWPVRTNAGFLARIAHSDAFVRGEVDTGFIDRNAATLIPSSKPSAAVVEAAAQALLPGKNGDPWVELTGFRTNAPREISIPVDIGGDRHTVSIAADGRNQKVRVELLANGERVAFHAGDAWSFALPTVGPGEGLAADSDGAVLAPMPGIVVSVEVSDGDSVKRGQRLVVLEAMKMEQVLIAPVDGVVTDLRAQAGAHISEGTALLHIVSEES